MPRTAVRILPRLRVLLEGTIILGPGKADLLAAIEETGTLRDAAAALDMSYMRAWNLVKTMNEAFREPLVLSTRGGATRGHAELTPAGLQALRLYRQMEKESLRAIREPWNVLKKMLR